MSEQSEQSKETRKDQNFPEVYEYLRIKSSSLSNDYRTPDGDYVESCALIAIDIAKMLLSASQKPELVMIQGPEIREGGMIGNKPIIPKIYEGRVKWGAHTVCINNGIVYDPMVGEPKTLEEYTRSTFMGPVETKITVSKNEIEAFVNR